MSVTAEIIESEPEHLPVPTGIVGLPVSVDAAVAEWRDYLELTKLLLDDSDYQATGSKRFKKKSAWRKYAKAFRISDCVTFEEIKRDESFHPIYARIRVRATHDASGRTAEGDHECHVRERCCPVADGQPCAHTSKYHKHCPKGCNGKIHWSHPGDIPATATTRAKNRAIADLIGAGEVSAEEVGERDDGGGEPAAKSPPCPVCGGQMWDNREGKKNPKAPDFKCKNKDCKGVIWPPKEGEQKAPSQDNGSRSPFSGDAEPTPASLNEAYIRQRVVTACQVIRGLTNPKDLRRFSDWAEELRWDCQTKQVAPEPFLPELAEAWMETALKRFPKGGEPYKKLVEWIKASPQQALLGERAERLAAILSQEEPATV